MSINKTDTIKVLTHAIAVKSLRKGERMFINTCHEASLDDLCALLADIRAGKNRLVDMWQDHMGYHFVTLR